MLLVCEAAARCLQIDGAQRGWQATTKTEWLSRRRLCGYPMGDNQVPQSGVGRGYAD